MPLRSALGYGLAGLSARYPRCRVPDFARQTGHLKKFANSLIRENIYEHCWLFMAIPDHIFRPPADQYNPQMLNRFETDENPYNICLTSADK